MGLFGRRGGDDAVWLRRPERLEDVLAREVKLG